ncbi:MAG: hypothetical protein EOR84_14700 [Mesorhizobium sp.]|uniref:hypothetical protein n=1 Tax=Mesorhizobium sp. TaxID=1871066 RepID=UPI000FE90E83|nr:hypothetical protein [Mesorhizobium sp.]RWM95812.1 MAG: hypothetical protein EOR84_14700 [Mesorhizobium sp.]
MNDEDLQGLIGELEDRLVQAEAAILEVEGFIATAQMIRGAAGGGKQALAAVLGPISERLQAEVEELLKLPDPVIEALGTLDEQLQGAPDTVEAILDQLDARLDELLDDLAGDVDTLCDQATEAIETVTTEIDAKLTSLTEGVDEVLSTFEKGIETVDDVLDDTVGRIDAIREGTVGQALDFVGQLESSLGRVTDGLEDIERVIQPVMPVITALEAVT